MKKEQEIETMSAELRQVQMAVKILDLRYIIIALKNMGMSVEAIRNAVERILEDENDEL